MNDFGKPNKERIRAVFEHRKPDRVPNFEVLISDPALSYVMGRNVPPCNNSFYNIDPRDYMELAQKIGQDVIGMTFYENPFRYKADDGTVYPAEGAHETGAYHIRGRKEFEKLLPPVFDTVNQKFVQLDEYAKAVQGSDIGLFVLTADFFTCTYDELFGFDNFMIQLYDDRDMITDVLDMYTDFYVDVVKRLMEYDLTFLYIGDDIAYKNGPFIDPGLMKELWMPRMKKIMEPAANKGMPILFHSDGDISLFLDDLIGMGVCAINPVEPYGMDIVELKKRYANNLSFVGNLDVGGNLSIGTPDDVRKEAEQLIDNVGKDGGLVLASSHSITENVRPENFLAMVETAQTYGRY